jgi:hypothetical protein
MRIILGMLCLYKCVKLGMVLGGCLSVLLGLLAGCLLFPSGRTLHLGVAYGVWGKNLFTLDWAKRSSAIAQEHQH